MSEFKELNIKQVDPSYNLKELMYFNYFIGRYVDVKINCRDGQVKTHSSIIMENPVFKSLLEHNTTKVVNLPQLGSDGVKVILEYLYRGESEYEEAIEADVVACKEFFQIKDDVDEEYEPMQGNNYNDSSVIITTNNEEVIDLVSDDNDSTFNLSVEMNKLKEASEDNSEFFTPENEELVNNLTNKSFEVESNLHKKRKLYIPEKSDDYI